MQGFDVVEIETSNDESVRWFDYDNSLIQILERELPDVGRTHP